MYCYARVSTEEQGSHGVSLDAQEKQLLNFALTKGDEESEIVRDVVSASVPLFERKGGKKLNAKLVKGDVVVAIKLDRLFRSTTDSLSTIDDWIKRGIDVVILSFGGQSMDTRSPVGRLFLTLIAAFAEFERGMIRERTKSALDHIKKSGKARTKLRPFGYDMDDNRHLLPREDEQTILNKMIFMKLHGSKTRDIAKLLNDQGIKSPGGYEWDHGMVSRVLRNELERRSRLYEAEGGDPIARSQKHAH